MPGTVLLLAASPVGKGCLVDAASVLPVLAAVSPEVLSGTGTANVVELADPLEPQAVLTRLRAAATAPGPLTVYLTGQLQLDRKQRLVHLALARTTPATVRYTAFPWHWMVEELRLRAPGSTTLFLDLHADAEVWRQLAGRPLPVGPGANVYGRIAPPPSRRGVAVPQYMKALATILRSGQRLLPSVLHEQVLLRTTEYGDILLAQDAGAPGGGPRGEPVAVVPEPAVVLPEQATVLSGQVIVLPEPPAGVPKARTGAAKAGEAEDGGAESREAEAAGAEVDDPHLAITTAVQDGRHAEADALAARWEEAARREFGAGTAQELHWREVRADLAMFAGDAARSCGTWMGVAEARLAAGQDVRDPAVEAAVDRAHHQWGQIGDPRRAGELGLRLVELRSRVPGRREGALHHVRQHLAELRSAQHVPG
ncbi:hypothetical protein [Streptomyces sp. MA5143a]|uniref:hypothetical protein n=1 Tax=Streptomyces sp. MA5143a TaxID=2083010 RepID=UPI000D1B0BE7|nr:hypothetical protein [Streptomyces sp. MA5143a]SPF01629.1 hypothetical protein SMA5143A_2363 [Streptomyces sp. MA5143a]